MTKTKIRIKRFGPLGRPRWKEPPGPPVYHWTVMVPGGNRGLRMSFPTWEEAMRWALKICQLRKEYRG